MGHLSVRVATVTDREAIFDMLRSAAIWLRGRGIDYWQNWLDPPAHHIAWIDDGLSAGEFRIVSVDRSIIGCYRLQDSDELFWGGRTEAAGYLHSLTVDRSRAGEGLGEQVIRRVAADLRSRGIGMLRLDCGECVNGLRRYYESLGFTAVGTSTVDGETLVLYEKPTA